MASTGINSSSGKTYLTRLKVLCDTSGILPSSLMLSGEIGDLGTRPLKSGGSTDIHKATYRGRLVAVKSLNIRRTQKLEDPHKVGARGFLSIVKYMLTEFPRGWSRRLSGGHGSGTRISCRSSELQHSRASSRWSQNGSRMGTL